LRRPGNTKGDICAAHPFRGVRVIVARVSADR
jgi:hypothetical protein